MVCIWSPAGLAAASRGAMGCPGVGCVDCERSCTRNCSRGLALVLAGSLLVAAGLKLFADHRESLLKTQGALLSNCLFVL